MTIRVRFALWFAGVLFLSLIAMGSLSYYELVVEPRQKGSSTAYDPAETPLSETLEFLAWCGVLPLGLALAGGWWLMRQSLAPITALTQAAEGINEHNLHQRLPRTGNGDELDRLTEVFNAMTERLERSFLRIREFTLHASHELKTPLTVIHGELETALQDASLTTTRRQHLESQLDEIQRLTKIVDGLTLLTKADAGQIALKQIPVPLDELVNEAYGDAQSLARPHEIEVHLDAVEKLMVTGDRHRLRQLLLNLSDNAIKYNHRQGEVRFALRRVADTAVITISNTGEPITPEALPRLFERFFRGDPSHSSRIEGCGLGLSIAQWIAQAHGGTIELASGPGQPVTATLRLPLRSAAQADRIQDFAGVDASPQLVQ
jgi:signal transduction histidine kinase